MDMDIHEKSVDMGMDMDVKFHIHGKPDDFHVILKPICHFLLVINSILCSVSHRFRDTTNFSLNFAPPSLFNPQFENVPITLDR